MSATRAQKAKRCDAAGRYQKCAEMMLEMKQMHDACSSFLEAAVSRCACENNRLKTVSKVISVSA